MPVVPTYTASIAPQNLPSVRQDASGATPDAFGAGLAEGIGKIALEEKQRANTSQFMDAQTKLLAYENSVNDPTNPNGANSAKYQGANWGNLNKDLMPDYQQQVSAIVGGITDDDLRDKFTGWANGRAQEFNSELNRKALAYKDQYEGQVFQGFTEQSAQDAAQAIQSGDPSAQVKVQNLLGGMESYFKTHGHGIVDPTSGEINLDDFAKMHMQKTVSNIYRNVIESTLATKDAATAQAQMEQFGPMLTYEDAQAVDQKIKPILRMQQGQDFILSGVAGQPPGSSGKPNVPPSAAPDRDTFVNAALPVVARLETGGLPNGGVGATSRTGAMGTYQFEPGTAMEAAKRIGWNDFQLSDLKNPDPAVQAKVRQMAASELGLWYDKAAQAGVPASNCPQVALAAYNMGGPAAIAWGTGKPYKTQSGVEWTPKFPCDPNAMPAETRAYIAHSSNGIPQPGTAAAATNPAAPSAADLTRLAMSAPPEIRRQAVQYASEMTKANNEQRIQDDKARHERVWGAINSAPHPAPLAAIIADPADYAWAQTQSNFKEMEKAAMEGPLIKDDPATANYVEHLQYKALTSGDPADAQAFVALNVPALSGKLTESSRQRLIDAQGAVEKSSNKIPELESDSKMLYAAFNNLGFAATDETPVTMQNRADFRAAYDNMKAAAVADNGGKPLSLAARQTIIDDLQRSIALQNYTRKQTFTTGKTGSQTFTMPTFPADDKGTSKVPLYSFLADAARDDPQKVAAMYRGRYVGGTADYINNVRADVVATGNKTGTRDLPPAEMVGPIVDQFQKKKGVAPTPEQIIAVWHNWPGRGGSQ